MTARFGLVERRLQTLATTSDAVCCGRRDIVALNQWQFVAVLLALTASLSGQTVQPEKSRSHPSPDAQAKVSPYQPIGNKQRVQWFVESTIGPQSLAGGIFSAGFGTAANTPKEYGGTWEGFGKRYGMRLTGISTGNAIEAGAGSLWGEDPRYSRANGEAFGGRLRNIVKLTFGAYRSNGELAPAYARYIAISGNNFLSNTWRARSESNAGQAALRLNTNESQTRKTGQTFDMLTLPDGTSYSESTGPDPRWGIQAPVSCFHVLLGVLKITAMDRDGQFRADALPSVIFRPEFAFDVHRSDYWYIHRMGLHRFLLSSGLRNQDPIVLIPVNGSL